jgi:hypothetical protein
MKSKEVRIEFLLGRRVRALNGRVIGRIEEIRGEMKKGECLITEFHVGSYAVMERLASLSVGRAFLRRLGARSKDASYRVSWDQLDLSDPDKPHLLCQTKVLKTL